MDDQEISRIVQEAYGNKSPKLAKDSGFKNNINCIGDTDSNDKNFLIGRKPSTPDLLFELEAQIVRLKHSLEFWREIVVPLYSVLLWEKNWYPGGIVGGTTFLFLSLWILDPSILTTFSILGLTATISDYLVPTLTAALFKSDAWTSVKEKAFDEFCRSIVVYKTKVYLSCSSFYATRTTRPKYFYGFTIVTLAVLAWIGNSFNNLFLTYLLATTLLLVPGMEHHGVLHKYGTILTQKMKDCSFLKTSHFKKE